MRRHRVALAGLAIAIGATTGARVTADGPGAAVAFQRAPVPFPDWVRSLETIDHGVVVYRAPDARSGRRGTVSLGVRLPLLGRYRGTGCDDGRFVKVGVDAHVCERDVRPGAEPPGTLTQAHEPAPDPEFLFVRSEAARGYLRLEDADTDEYESALAKGFGVAVADRLEHAGARFVKSHGGLFVRAAALRPARPSPFAGVELGADGSLSRVAWVVVDGASLLGPKGERARAARRLERLRVHGEDGRFVRLDDGLRVEARVLTRPRPAEPPPDLAEGERWIDVDLARQTLVAYEGARPVFATLVSTGKPGRTRTPAGDYRVWVKLARSDMDDVTPGAEDEPRYLLEQVPHVQFFHQGYGLHATYWHDRFGTRQSRGCVNLSPGDARWLFEFTGPELSTGWEAVLPTTRDRGTRIVVRDDDVPSRAHGPW